jgi:hypothetical protein
MFKVRGQAVEQFLPALLRIRLLGELVSSRDRQFTHLP